MCISITYMKWLTVIHRMDWKETSSHKLIAYSFSPFFGETFGASSARVSPRRPCRTECTCTAFRPCGSLCAACTEMVKKDCPRLREFAPAGRGSQDAGSRNLGQAFFTIPVVGPVGVRLHAVRAAVGAIAAVDGGHVALEVLSGGAPPRAEHARELLHAHVEAVLVVLREKRVQEIRSETQEPYLNYDNN